MTNLKNQPFGGRLRNAGRGLAHALCTERSLRLQGLGFLAVTAALALLRPGAAWSALVLLSCGAVLGAELFNTALEALVDHLHPQLHERIGRVKDCAAAAVLVNALAALGVAAALAWHLLRPGG
jgi:diacylglycerol kinase (ATP)